MRSAPVTFTAIDESPSKAARFVVAILYEVDSIYVTSHEGIANVPGDVIEGALAEPSIVSQRLKPDEAAAEIGAASFSLVDLGMEFTARVRERLADDAGLRGKQVRFYLGYEELPFEDYQLIGTQIVTGVSYDKGKYNVECLDIQRSLRSDVFELQTTTLAATISPTDTTITLTSTTGLHRVQHGTSYSDAPNALVGYVKIKNEVVRYTDIVGNQLVGCTRGVFGTIPEGYNVDPATQADRREKVSEFVYLELPAIKLAYALLTGVLHGSSETLPSKWHLGIDAELVALEDFTSIGNDIWNPTDDNAGLVVSFQGLTKQDGKRFLEKELFLLMGVYSPVYADGTLGLRRAVALREDAATVLTLDDTNSVQVGALVHDMGSVYNAFLINWSWNGEEFRRSTAYVDPQSRAKHGSAETMTLNFKGLRGGRHTDSAVLQLLDMVRDRYAGPPLRITVDVLHALNKIEVGDIVRGRWASVRDFSGQLIAIDRSFEVQSVAVNHATGRVTVELFASTAEASAESPTRATVALHNSYYTSAGTALANAPGVTIVNNVLTGATDVLSGAADMNAPAAIYYHDADLTIANGVTLRIADNVQIRVRGFLQANGLIDGRGRGHAGVADDGRALAISTANGGLAAEGIPGAPGHVGTTRGYDGVRTRTGLLSLYLFCTWPPHLTTGAYGVAPRLLLNNANGTQLRGIPSDLRGGGGGPGGRVGSSNDVPYPAEARGGAGASGGAGLLIVCRGMAFGSSGSIDLSGTNSEPTTPYSVRVGGTDLVRHPGAGAGGGPGACYVLLDGASLSTPDFSGNKFRSRAGAIPIPSANALQDRRSNGWVPNSSTYDSTAPRVMSPIMGYADAEFTSSNGKDYSGSALVVQYVPGEEIPVDDDADLPDAPVAITTESIEQGINVRLAFHNFDWDTVALYASVDNQRQNAVKVGEGKFDLFRIRVPDGATRRFWTRTRNAFGFSRWFPESPVGGVPGAALGGLIARGGAEAFGTSAKKPANTPAGWNADVYSAETYSGGVYLSFQPSSTVHSLMVGLNSDPESDSSYTSLDYAWHCTSGGTVAIYEGGTLVGNYGAYTPLTVLSIKYDGQQVAYFKDGALIRATPRVGAVFFIDSAFDTPGGGITNLKFGALTTAPSIPWVVRGNCIGTASTIRKEGGTIAWDSDAYSFEAYRAGSFLSFQPDRTNAELMCGLNSDPTADQSYTSLDYCWYCGGDGVAYVYESNANVGAFGTYTTDTVLAIAYDGRTVRYLRNGSLVREVYSPDRTFFLDSSFRHPGGSIRNVTWAPYGSATPVPFLARSTSIIVSDTAAQKIPGTSAAWDADFISVNGYPICFCEFKASRTDMALMVGLNSDPYSDQSYASIDAAWYPAGDGVAYIYEHGNQIATVGIYTPATVFALTYDGSSLRYYKDGIVVRTVALPGRTMFLDASLYTPGAAINSLRFGPGSSLSIIDTPQLRPNSATYSAQSFQPGPVALSASSAFYGDLVHEFSPPSQSVDCVLEVVATFECAAGSMNGTQITLLGATIGGVGYSADAKPYVNGGGSGAMQSQTIKWNFNYTAGSAVTLGLRWNSAFPTYPASATYRNITISCNFIKR
jgi:hypothetical protein